MLDTRDPAEFAAAHLPGSINIGLGGQYATWAGTMLSRERPIVIIADPGRESESAVRLGRIGFDHVVGYLEGRPAQHRIARGPDGHHRARQCAGGRRTASRTARPILVDVRTPGEREQKHVAGSVSMPLNHLAERSAGTAARPSAAGSLRGRLPLVDCGQPAAAAGFTEVERNRRRPGGVGSGETSRSKPRKSRYATRTAVFAG